MTPDQLRRLYEDEKLSTRQIAERLQLNKETVRLLLRRAGIPMRSKHDACLIRDQSREWTPERVKMLRNLWLDGVICRVIKERLGISYGVRAISAKALALGLPPRQEPRQRPVRNVCNVKPAPEPVAPRAAFVHRSLISFAPNQRMQLLWLTALAETKAARGSASQAKWGF